MSKNTEKQKISNRAHSKKMGNVTKEGQKIEEGNQSLLQDEQSSSSPSGVAE